MDLKPRIHLVSLIMFSYELDPYQWHKTLIFCDNSHWRGAIWRTL